MKLLMNNSLVRFLLVGVVNTFVGISTMYFLLNLIGLNYWLSTFFGNTVGALVSYILNKTFTFKSRMPISKSLWKFIIVILLCYLSSFWLSIRLASWLSDHFSTIKPIVDESAVLLGTAIYTISNYVGQKSFVFKQRSNSRDEESGK